MTVYTVESSFCHLTKGKGGEVIIESYTCKYSSASDGCLSKKKCITALILLGVILIAGALTTVTVMLLDGNLDEETQTEVDPGADAPANYTLRLVTRGQWSSHAELIKQVADLKYKPARYVVVCHTAGHFCVNPQLCANQVRNSESWQIQTGILAISYNFLIGGDGYIYEGRGWGREGAHSQGFNCASVGIAFIGNFENYDLTPPMIETYNILVAEGLRRKALSEDYKMFSHSQVIAVLSPGSHVIEHIHEWPHWAPFKKNYTICH